jgi:hypothetical protein
MRVTEPAEKARVVPLLDLAPHTPAASRNAVDGARARIHRLHRLVSVSGTKDRWARAFVASTGG